MLFSKFYKEVQGVILTHIHITLNNWIRMRLILHINTKFEQAYTMCHNICLIIILASDNGKSRMTRNNHINEWYNRIIEKKNTPCWISCKANAFAQYFHNIITTIIPPKTKILGSAMDNIKFNLFLLLWNHCHKWIFFLSMC